MGMLMVMPVTMLVTLLMPVMALMMPAAPFMSIIVIIASEGSAAQQEAD